CLARDLPGARNVRFLLLLFALGLAGLVAWGLGDPADADPEPAWLESLGLADSAATIAPRGGRVERTEGRAPSDRPHRPRVIAASAAFFRNRIAKPVSWIAPHEPVTCWNAISSSAPSKYQSRSCSRAICRISQLRSMPYR